MLDTARPEEPPRVFEAGDKFPLYGRSLALFRISLRGEVGQAVTSTQVEGLRKDARKANQLSPNTPPLVR